MPVKWPPGDSLMLAVLRSPAHFLLSGAAIELRYAGRRSGRQYGLPVPYARDEKRLVVVPQRASPRHGGGTFGSAAGERAASWPLARWDARVEAAAVGGAVAAGPPAGVLAPLGEGAGRLRGGRPAPGRLAEDVEGGAVAKRRHAFGRYPVP